MLTGADVKKLEEIALNNSDNEDVAWLVNRLNQLNQVFQLVQRREALLRAALRELL